MSGCGNVCAYPWQQMVIDLTGEVVPCCFWSGYGNSGKPLGNSNVNTLEEIWNGPGYTELRQRIVSDTSPDFPCNNCMAYKWGQGSYPKFVWPTAFTLENGHCFVCRILDSFLEKASKLEGEWILYENGKPLGPGDTLHAEIREKGEGRFSVWGENLYMSASDNSNPSENGYTYELARGALSYKVKTTDMESKSGQNLRRAFDEYSEAKVSLEAKPTMVSFIATSDCNIDCPMCSQNKVRKYGVQHRQETQQELLSLVPFLTQLIWHGGEPFLIKDFREFYTNYKTSDNPNLTFGFTSNGTLITPQVVENLKKFPRLNASISVDSFKKESFEIIREGARYDIVMPFLLNLLKNYDAPDRIFSVGAIVMKSNILELADNLRYAIEHDIGLNVGPVVVYPVHERLDLFSNVKEQTAGWAEVLQEAKDVIQKAIKDNRKAIIRTNPLGMVEGIEIVIQEGLKRYAHTTKLTVHIEDPHDSLRHMHMPGMIFLRRDYGHLPLSYLICKTPGTYTVEYPTAELEGHCFSYFYPDLYDETVRFDEVPLKTHKMPLLREVTVVIPKYDGIARVSNVRVSKGGAYRPGGLVITDVSKQLL